MVKKKKSTDTVNRKDYRAIVRYIMMKMYFFSSISFSGHSLLSLHNVTGFKLSITKQTWKKKEKYFEVNESFFCLSFFFLSFFFSFFYLFNQWHSTKKISNHHRVRKQKPNVMTRIQTWVIMVPILYPPKTTTKISSQDLKPGSHSANIIMKGS